MKKLWLALMIVGVGGCQVLEASDPGPGKQRSTLRQRASHAKKYVKTKVSNARKTIKERLPTRRGKKSAPPSQNMDKAFETLREDYPQVFDDHQPHGLNMPKFLAAIKPLREKSVSNHPLYTISLYMGTLDKIAAEQEHPTHPLVLTELQRLKAESAKKLSVILTPEQIAALPPLSQANSAASKSGLWQKAQPKEWRRSAPAPTPAASAKRARRHSMS